MMADDVPHQQPNNEGCSAAQIIRPEDVEQVPVPAMPQDRDAVGTDAGEGHRGILVE